VPFMNFVRGDKHRVSAPCGSGFSAAIRASVIFAAPRSYSPSCHSVQLLQVVQHRVVGVVLPLAHAVALDPFEVHDHALGDLSGYQSIRHRKEDVVLLVDVRLQQFAVGKREMC